MFPDKNPPPAEAGGGWEGRLESEVDACRGLSQVGDFVEVQAVDIKVRNLVNVAAILATHAEVTVDVKVHAGSIDECAFGLTLRTGHYVSIRRIEHESASTGKR